MKKTILLVSVITLNIGCHTFKPFSSQKEKHIALQSIKTQLNLNKHKIKSLQKHDSVIFELYSSLKQRIKPKLIKRRIDSFSNKNYTLREFKLILKLDRTFPNDVPIEFIRGENIEAINVNGIEGIKKFNKEFKLNIGAVKKDSL
jgi:hypothetical protein